MHSEAVGVGIAQYKEWKLRHLHTNDASAWNDAMKWNEMRNEHMISILLDRCIINNVTREPENVEGDLKYNWTNHLVNVDAYIFHKSINNKTLIWFFFFSK